MSDLAVPLPPAAVPAGAPAWMSDDAARWAAIRVPAWARVRWSVLALLVSVVAATLLEPDPACTVAAPCGPDWGSTFQVGLALALLLWYPLLPELTLVGGPLLAVIVAGAEFQLGGAASDTANAAVIAALAFGWAAVWTRLAVRRRQRLLAEQAARGVRHPVPAELGPARQGTLRLVLGALLCVAAAVAVGLGLHGIHQDEHRAAGAESVASVVVGKGDSSVRVRTPGGGKLTVHAEYPEDYDTGSTVTVLRRGDWHRLAAEPYDAAGWQMLTLVTAVPGLSLLISGALARRRALRLRRRPVPVLRVLIRDDRVGDTWVFAADDTAGDRPLFGCNGVTEEDDDSDGDEGWTLDDPPVDIRLREALLYGTPYDYAEFVLAAAALDDQPAPELREARARRVPPGEQPRLDPPNPDPGPRGPDRELADRTAAAMRPADRPVRWGPSVLTRSLGVLLSSSLVVVIASEVGEGSSPWRLLLLIVIVAVAPGEQARFLNWSITADRSGLWLGGSWRVLHLPWDDLRSVGYDGGDLDVHRTDGRTWTLTSVSWPWLERRLRVRPAFVRAVAEITAMQTHPELRPTADAPKHRRGLPLGPLMALLLAGLTVALFLV